MRGPQGSLILTDRRFCMMKGNSIDSAVALNARPGLA